MPLRIEDYAVIGDCETAALVGRDGSIDWLCLPRFDSGACFAGLLGGPEHGRFRICPAGKVKSVRRAYRKNTLILETEFETEDGSVVVIDCMPERGNAPDVVRLVVGKRGRVRVAMELVIRFEYGADVPWVRRTKEGITAVAGPNSLRLATPVDVKGENFKTVASFDVAEGERVPFVLTWCPSNEVPPAPPNAEKSIAECEKAWLAWCKTCTYRGDYADAVMRSLITLKSLTYAPTGGIVAAITTSLPEKIGGVRNWDYRFCWLRDATFTLYAMMNAGYYEEATAWRDWLLRAIAGMPSQLQIMYGVGGERRLTELELPWLPGYEGSKPVRIGNGASTQLQLDVYGEVMDTLHLARRNKIDQDPAGWNVQRTLMGHLETIWKEPDEGIWEVRGPRRHFTHSKVMAWVAFDRAVKAVEQFKCEGPVERWRTIRDAIHADVCKQGFDAGLGSFVQYYGSGSLDASLLMIPLVGFLPATDARVRGTIAAIERDLMKDGFIQRYHTKDQVDGLPPGEGAFLACTFWFADNLQLIGREADARRIFERLLTLRNDVGLLAEEYDPASKRLVGNFPQAFSHVSLVNTAQNLAHDHEGPSSHRPNS